MRLDSARELKQLVRARAEKLLGLGQINISVGVTPSAHPDGFRLALRLRSRRGPDLELAEWAGRQAAKEIDTRATGPVRRIDGSRTESTSRESLAIGSTVSHEKGRNGSLGFFATRRSDGAPGIVSNNHVLALEDLANDGDGIIHPAAGEGKPQLIARLDGNYPRLNRGGVQRVDCAFAALVAHAPRYDPGALGENDRLRATPALPLVDQLVWKVGRTSLRTEGRITAAELEQVVAIGYHFGQVRFAGQIEIESATKETFSDPGDSGALVFDASLQPVGLLFAETAAGGSNGMGLHYANPIAAVLDSLGVDLLV